VYGLHLVPKFGIQRQETTSGGTRGFIVETPYNVEISHCTETFSPHSMFYFRATKSFHVDRH
jgi:hypothetical protein